MLGIILNSVTAVRIIVSLETTPPTPLKNYSNYLKLIRFYSLFKHTVSSYRSTASNFRIFGEERIYIEWKEAILDYREILLQKIQNCLPVYPVFRYRFKVGIFYALSHLSCRLRQLSDMFQMNVTTEGHSDMQRMIAVFFPPVPFCGLDYKFDITQQAFL